MFKIICIADFILSHIRTHSYSVTADLPSEEYIRPQFLLSDLRFDIIMWSAASHMAYLLELTTCFDTNFSAAAERKTTKYFELVDAMTSTTPYKYSLYTLQVGSWGIIEQDSFNPIRSILQCKRKDFSSLLLSLSITVLTKSFKV